MKTLKHDRATTEAQALREACLLEAPPPHHQVGETAWRPDDLHEGRLVTRMDAPSPLPGIPKHKIFRKPFDWAYPQANPGVVGRNCARFR